MSNNKIKVKTKAIRHFLLPFNREERTQSCAICGQVIHDYRGAMYAPISDGSPVVENGWEPGPHYITGNNPKYFSSTEPSKKDYNIIACSITIHTNR